MNAERLVLAATLAAGTMMPSATWAWIEREASVEASPAALHGTMTLPHGAKPAPAVLILAGSGPVDRDGNSPGLSNDSLKLLAHDLADRGVISLRVDKRGVGAGRAAGPREEQLRFGTYVDDAVKWLDVLRAEPRVSRLYLLGHSEGALVATLAAQQAQVVGVVLIAGAGEPAGPAIERQLAAASVPESVRAVSHRIMARLNAGRLVPSAPADLAPLFRPSVQPYLISWLRLDPAAELARVRVPALIVQGTTDLQVSVDDGRRLAAARPGATLVLVEGMNHVLRRVQRERAANLATYADPELPLAPETVSAIVAFLSR